MKMKKEHYNTLEKSINEVITNVGKDEVIKYRNNVKFVKDQFISFIWGMWGYSTDQDFRTELYKYLNDAHVETALKQILSNYK